MLWKKHTRARSGGRIRAHQMNDMQRAAEFSGKLSATSPIGIIQTPGGACLYWAAPSPYLRFFLPQGAIPAASGTAPNVTVGSGTADGYYRDPSTGRLTPWGYSATIYNWAPFAVGGSGNFILCAYVDGDWTVVNDACPAS